ncbi:MAG: hypothetical protein HZA81_03735 [Candidatus Taylorbacteria bacterium]|nr:hypothetical protein [Candidatus Taylorbacteria bacterium]
MFGIALTALGSFLDETAASIGKWAVTHKKEPLMVMGFLNVFWVSAIFGAVALFKGEFAFAPAALPLFLTRSVFEIAQFHIGLLATVKSDRSALGFLMILTLPLLLAVDTVLGYEMTTLQLLGVATIVLSLALLLVNHGISKKGLGYALFIAINPVITISMFKYSITHYNTVEVEQSLMFGVLAVYGAAMSYVMHRENPFKYLKNPLCLAHSLLRGVSGTMHSFAYVFAPASVITTAKRAASLFAAVVSGNVYFHEKHLVLKLASFSLIVLGLILIVV